MPLESRDGESRPGPTGPLGHRLPADATAQQVAAAVHHIWGEVDQALHPVIGHRGVLALYNRSLNLASARHPWLAVGHAGALAAVDPPALREALARQSPAEALAASQALLQSFRDLLGSLIGEALTDRLLHSVWGPAPESAPVDKNT